MRKWALPTILVACSLFAACGSDDGGDAATTTAATSQTTTAATTDGDGAFPVVVPTAFGDVTIESQPERVVALGWGDAEIALSLGVQPIGASDWLGFGGEGVGPWSAGLYDTPPELIGTMEPSYEAIAALNPDLILDVRGSGDPDRHDRLAQIATTVGIPEGGEGYLTTTEQQTTMIAAALGVPDQGAALLADVDAKFAEVAAAHPDWKGKTISVVARTSEGWSAYIEGDGRVDFLLALGFTQNPQLLDMATSALGFTIDISQEQLSVLDADLIVAFPIFIESTEITNDPLWKNIPAVADGRVVLVDGDLSNAYSLATPTAQIYAIEHIEPLIAEALGS